MSVLGPGGTLEEADERTCGRQKRSRRKEGGDEGDKKWRKIFDCRERTKKIGEVSTDYCKRTKTRKLDKYKFTGAEVF